ncbi:MAG: ATP-binding protein [Armatimonadota bacterium]|nr:ATP-binding protein [Armatimonadota bacterium]
MGLHLYAGGSQRSRARNDVAAEALRLARSAREHHRLFIASAQHLLPVLARVIQEEPWDPARCSRLFGDLLAQHPTYANLGVAAPDGVVVCSARPSRRPVSVADRQYFQHAARYRTFSVGEYQIGRITGQPTINFGYPVIGPGGTLRGVVFAAVSLAALERASQRIGLPDGGALIVVDRNATVLARQPHLDGLVGRTLPEAPIVRLLRVATAEGVAEAPGADGVRRLYAFTPLDDTGAGGRVVVAVGIPLASVYTAIDRATAANIVGVLLVAGLVLAAAMLVADREVLRPVRALLDAATRLGSGHLATRVGEVGGAAEVREMARTFDEMAAGLQAKTMELDGSRAALERHARRLELMHGIGRAVLSAPTPAAIAADALPPLVALAGAQYATLLEYAPGAEHIAVIAVHGAAPHAAGARLSLADLGITEAALGRLRQGDVVDLAARGPARAAPAPTENLHAVPLRIAGDLRGFLVIANASPLGAEGLQILREIADQLAIGIHQAHLHAALEQYAADLERAVAVRTAELEEARRAAEAANRAKSEFLSRMSHELRTPLNAIVGFAQLLEMDRPADGDDEATAHILRASRHLLSLIDEVLDVARIEAGRMTISVEPVPLADILEQTLDLLTPLAAARGITLSRRPPEDTSLHALADAQRLKQVLLNLGANAIKYNVDGGAVTITVEGRSDGRVRLAVADTGPGIPPGQVARLFVPFERLGAEGTGVQGTGLGLALSRRLTEAMGGTIGYEPGPRGGSVFWVEFPLAAGPTAVAASVETERAAAVSPEITVAPRTVLYLEDNVSNLRLVERLVARRPYIRLVPAMQGRLGWDLALEHRPDLILLDLHLPDVPGDELLRRFKAHPNLQHIPVVVLSADATAARVQQVRELGAVAYLTKPVDVARLLRLLDELLGHEGPVATR